ncbi:MAG: hypothetical protein EZS28_055125, partial [Streblomastix strix]
QLFIQVEHAESVVYIANEVLPRITELASRFAGQPLDQNARSFQPQFPISDSLKLKIQQRIDEKQLKEDTLLNGTQGNIDSAFNPYRFERISEIFGVIYEKIEEAQAELSNRLHSFQNNGETVMFMIGKHISYDVISRFTLIPSEDDPDTLECSIQPLYLNCLDQQGVNQMDIEP